MNRSTGILHLVGWGVWTASVLPALAGTSLPFWLRPPGFSFRWVPAVEFLFATVLLHSGLSLLLAHFHGRPAHSHPPTRLLGMGVASIVAACLLGPHLSRLVPKGAFVVFGVATIWAGLLYVVPPFSLHRRVGGEVVAAEGLGMLPVLGAYLVQTGDLTRTVYPASLPLVAATGPWIWMAELASNADDERTRRRTAVRRAFALHFAICVIVAGSPLLPGLRQTSVARATSTPA
jgi:1,4-dihydroxy-2-naphthoate octaprenyltransferase